MALSSWTSSIKVGFMICSVASIVLAMNAMVPVMTDLAEAVVFCFQLCLKPPYLYLVVNFIIIAVVAASRLQESNFNYQNYSIKTFNFNYNLQPQTPPPPVFAPVTRSVSDKDYILNTPLPLSNQMVVYEQRIGSEWPQKVGADEKVLPLIREGKYIVSTEPEHTPEFVTEKPIYPANPESTEAKIEALWTTETETLESAWSKINENRRIAKVDTWIDCSLEMDTAKVESQRKSIKTKTFKCKDKTMFDPRFSSSARAHRMGVELSRVGSLSQDELNQQVEAFIRKFNEQMRLQREESIQRNGY